MKTAIAIFGKRVSPRFDCANDFMLITVANHTITEKFTAKIKDWFSISKVKKLVDLEVDTLICGGVDEHSVENLRFHGINVLRDVKGDVDEAVANYLAGKLNTGKSLNKKRM